MTDADEAGERARVFTVRIWSEQTRDGCERRGRVRDVVTGAFCSFREWSDLTAFLAEQLADERMSEQEA